MKKVKELVAMFILASVSIFLLAGCGEKKDALSQQMVEDIESIGDVTLDDEELITELESTYNDMTDEQKNQVDNYVDLKNARKELDEIKEKELADKVNSDPYKSAIYVVKTIKETLYNPNSFDLIKVMSYGHEDEDWTSLKIRVDYSGENLLGGSVTNSIITQFDDGKYFYSWEKNAEDYDDQKRYENENMTFESENITPEILDTDFIMQCVNGDVEVETNESGTTEVN